MKTLSTWNFRSIMSKIIMGLVLVTMIGSINVTPVLAKDDHKRMGRHDNGRYEHRGQRYDRHGRYDRDRYGYDRRVYVAPPVVYVEPPPPGIQIFFPPVYIHH